MIVGDWLFKNSKDTIVTLKIATFVTNKTPLGVDVK
jgi:hypothetical protein